MRLGVDEFGWIWIECRVDMDIDIDIDIDIDWWMEIWEGRWIDGSMDGGEVR